MQNLLKELELIADGTFHFDNDLYLLLLKNKEKLKILGTGEIKDKINIKNEKS